MLRLSLLGSLYVKCLKCTFRSDNCSESSPAFVKSVESLWWASDGKLVRHTCQCKVLINLEFVFERIAFILLSFYLLCLSNC